MPTYVFTCCNDHSTEEFHSMSECPPAIICPECGCKAVKQMGTGAAIIFKGCNWPGQDYKRRREDQAIGRKANRARNLKASGKVPMEERIDLDDRKIQD